MCAVLCAMRGMRRCACLCAHTRSLRRCARYIMSLCVHSNRRSVWSSYWKEYDIIFFAFASIVIAIVAAGIEKFGKRRRIDFRLPHIRRMPTKHTIPLSYFPLLQSVSSVVSIFLSFFHFGFPSSIQKCKCIEANELHAYTCTMYIQTVDNASVRSEKPIQPSAQRTYIRTYISCTSTRHALHRHRRNT